MKHLWTFLAAMALLPCANAQVSTGTGFAVAPGLLITNHHVIDGCTAIEVVSAVGRRRAAVVDADPLIDLALLRVPGMRGGAAKLRSPNNVRLGEPVMVFGFPLSGSLTSGGNFTSGLVSGLRGLRDTVGEIQITAPVQPGNSGGPVMDASGSVVGVVVAKLDALRSAIATGDIPQNFNFVVSLDTLSEFLTKNEVLVRDAPATKPLDTASVAELAQSFTYRVECMESSQQATRSPKPDARPRAGQVIKDCADCPEMVVIPAGSFTMGSSAAEQALANAAGLPENFTRRENPQHRFNIRSFAAGRYAISRGEFAAFARAKGYLTEAERGDGCFAWNGKEWKKDRAYNWRNVGFTQADNHPVVCVSWNDAQAYIGWLNQSSGQTYRLLSEAEREYAARGGTQTAFWWGDSISTAQANYNGKGTSYNGSPQGEYRQTTVPVNSFSPNSFGLYNVHGNVWEWVEDCWHDDYSGAPADGTAWTTACSSIARVLRGGSWDSNPSILRSAFRIGGTPGIRGNLDGLRLARTLFTP